MYKIKPSDIDVKNGIWGSIWRNSETEASAYWLVKLAQQRGNWIPFTKEEIDAFCKEDFWFNYLTDEWIKKVSKVKLELVDCLPYVKDGKEYTQRVEEKETDVHYEYTREFINEVFRTNQKK